MIELKDKELALQQELQSKHLTHCEQELDYNRNVAKVTCVKLREEGRLAAVAAHAALLHECNTLHQEVVDQSDIDNLQLINPSR